MALTLSQTSASRAFLCCLLPVRKVLSSHRHAAKPCCPFPNSRSVLPRLTLSPSCWNLLPPHRVGVLPCLDGSKKTWIGGLHQETDVPHGPGGPKSKMEMALCPALVGALLPTGGQPPAHCGLLWPSPSAMQSKTPHSSSYRDANPARALSQPHLSPVPFQRPHLHTPTTLGHQGFRS